MRMASSRWVLSLSLLCWSMLPSLLIAQGGEPNLLGKPAAWADEAPTQVQISEGAVLRAEPATASQRLALLPACQLLARETRGSWIRVRLGDLDGWIDLEGETLPYIGAQASDFEPPQDPVAQAIELARNTLGENAQRGQLGPFELYHDIADEKLLELLEQLTPQVAEAFTARYGMEVEQLRGAVVLFAEDELYERLKRLQGNDIPFHSEGHAVPGLVAIKVGNRSRREVATTLIHELTHVIAWQVLGAALPPWLGEGLADDLSLARIDRQGRLQTNTFDSRSLRFGRNSELFLLSVVRSLNAVEPIRLVDLLSMDRQTFLDNPGLHYTLSALFVRFLLEDHIEGSAAAFTAYLRGVRAGSATYPDYLRERLGLQWGEIDVQFRLWARRTLARIQ